MIGIIVFLLNMKNAIKQSTIQIFKELQKCKRKIERECRDENVFLKGDRALRKLITLLISNKKEFKHFFKSRSSDIVLLKLGNLKQNAKRQEAHNTEREARSSHISEREARRPLARAPQARSFQRAKRAARDENVRAKRADFFSHSSQSSDSQIIFFSKYLQLADSQGLVGLLFWEKFHIFFINIRRYCWLLELFYFFVNRIPGQVLIGYQAGSSQGLVGLYICVKLSSQLLYNKGRSLLDTTRVLVRDQSDYIFVVNFLASYYIIKLVCTKA